MAKSAIISRLLRLGLQMPLHDDRTRIPHQVHCLPCVPSRYAISDVANPISVSSAWMVLQLHYISKLPANAGRNEIEVALPYQHVG